jgi:hypothetical protein
MSMARRYSSVTHRPAVLIFDPQGRIAIIALGRGLGVFVGQHLPGDGEAEQADGGTRD